MSESNAIKTYADLTGINTSPALGALTHAIMLGTLGRLAGKYIAGPAVSALEVGDNKFEQDSKEELSGSLRDERFRSRLKNLFMLTGAAGGASLMWPLLKENLNDPKLKGILNKLTAKPRYIRKSSSLASASNVDHIWAPTIPIGQTKSWVENALLPSYMQSNIKNIVDSAAPGKNHGFMSVGSVGNAALRAGVGAGMGMAGAKLFGWMMGANPGTRKNLERLGIATGVLANTFLGQPQPAGGLGSSWA
jgi:hypothetical protein